MAIYHFSTHEHVYPGRPAAPVTRVYHTVGDAPAGRTRPLYRGTQYVWYILSFVEALLGLRFVLSFVGANPGAPFANLIYGLSSVFLAPFRYILPASVAGRSVFEWSTLVAMLVYWLIAVGIVKLMIMSRPVSEAEARHRLVNREIL